MRRWPWWLQVSALYVAARLASACIFMAAALQQGTNPWFPAKPDYWNFINIWDARWYGEVITNGYPAALPVDAAGNVQENAWAFYPLFPFLGRALVGLTGVAPAAALTIVAMLSGLVAALVIYSLFRHKAAHSAACGRLPSSRRSPFPAYSRSYAEPLTVFLLATALLLVIRRHYCVAMSRGPAAVPLPACGRSVRRLVGRSLSADWSNGPREGPPGPQPAGAGWPRRPLPPSAGPPR